MLKKFNILLLVLILLYPASAISSNATPDQVLVIYEKTWFDTNGNGKSDSLDVAEYYMSKRNIPAENILEVDTGITGVFDTHISLADYETKIAAPVRNWLDTNSKKNKIFYIVMCLGMRYGIETTSTSVDALLTDPYTPIGGGRSGTFGYSPVRNATEERTSNTHVWTGRATPTPYYLVCRLDGPSLAICKGLVDKAVQAEKDKLWKYHPYLGYVDYGWATSAGWQMDYEVQCIRPNENLFISQGWMVTKETTTSLFSSVTNCLWYSGLYAHYFTGTFAFQTGAVALHMESNVATDFRNWRAKDLANQRWCAGFLNSGVTATAGTVDEPYITGTLMQDVFFDRFLKSQYKFNFANAIYAANAYGASSSADWMMIMIGDPLYCIYNSPADPVVTITANPFDIVKIYPQPFRPATSETGGMRWANLPVDVTIDIFDGSGKTIRTLKEAEQGNTTIVVWDGRDETGAFLPSGIYYYSANNGTHRKAGKIAYIK